ncbi:MAG: SH3 domain-containing protein [Chloroflexi bacterium]|nr:SH3 domain-containing protein [Chloroflexota bacterium]
MRLRAIRGKRRWAGLGLGLALMMFLYAAGAGYAQDPNPLASPTFDGPYIIVTGNEEPQINVRAGPSVDYDSIGVLVVGQRARALARTQNWVQIEYPGGPNGTGWVFAPLVRIENGLPPLVTPPPTPTPEFVPTTDPTLAAQYDLGVTQTPLPTFTPPPSLVIPTYPPPPRPLSDRFPMAMVILSLFVLGGLGMVISFLQDR